MSTLDWGLAVAPIALVLVLMVGRRYESGLVALSFCAAGGHR